jgi:hypothetical protein
MKLPVRIALLPLLLVAGLFGADAGTVLSSKTPFGPSRGAGGPTEAASETIEFTGLSTIGKKTDFVLYDKATKKSHWIAKGETKGGISLLNYDDKREQVVVKINGVEKTLSLRKPAGSSAAARTVAPVPTGFNIPAPTSPSAPGTAVETTALPPIPVPTNAVPAAPLTQVQQETEARMLVSDLLEIGMAQRKAYEEKLKQSGGNPPPPADASGPVPPKSGG